jgi:class 3 adenylate cyclase
LCLFCREVANRLKLGEPVPPDHFELATVLFSDLVCFTQLSARLSPLSVVNVINQLFTAFDAIIEEHDVYKVETIGPEKKYL